MNNTYRIMVRKTSGRYGQSPSQDYLRDIINMTPIEFQTLKCVLAKIRIMRDAPGYLALPAKFRPSYEVV